MYHISRKYCVKDQFLHKYGKIGGEMIIIPVLNGGLQLN